MYKLDIKFKIIFVLGFVFIICHPLSTYAVNTADCEIDNRFGAKEKRILEQACKIAVERMQSKEVRDKVIQKSGYAWLTSAIVDKSNIINDKKNRYNLLWQQLYTLSLPNGENDVEPAFPDIYILYGNESSNWLGRARYDLVTVYWDSSQKEWKQKGSFVLTINDHYVARDRRLSDPNDWAGTIAHEMAHNLGHRHPDSADSDYRKYQINVLDEIIQSYGFGFKGEEKSFKSENVHDDDAEESSGGAVTININGRKVIIKN